MASYNKVSYTTQTYRRTNYDRLWHQMEVWQVFSSNRHWKTSQTSVISQELYKRFTAMQSEGKPMTGPTIIEKAKSFYNKMKITDMCTFSEDCMQNLVMVW